jgi:hypothetical protein
MPAEENMWFFTGSTGLSFARKIEAMKKKYDERFAVLFRRHETIERRRPSETDAETPDWLSSLTYHTKTPTRNSREQLCGLWRPDSRVDHLKTRSG